MTGESEARARLVTFPEWILQPERCPCDLDFVELMKSHQLGRRPHTVFQLGPGIHHTVGRELALGNTILAITCSPPELSAYAQLAIENPTIARNYQCIFGDVYNTNPFFFSNFSLLYLPHLGERYGDADPRHYTGESPRSVLRAMLNNSDPDPEFVVTYAGSAAREAMNPIYIDLLDLYMAFKSLTIWKTK